jgi:hypothetical protein
MAQSLRTVRVLTLGTTGTQDITISGFGTCIGAIFDMNVGDTDNTVQTTDRSSIGFCDGTRQAVSAVGSVNGVTTTQTARIERDNAVIVDMSGNQSIAGIAVFDSFITDGVRINVTTASANRFCNVTLIGGDATNVYVNYSPSLGTSAGNTVISTVGFEPDLVQASCTGLDAVNAVGAHSIITRGIAVNDGADSNFMRGAFDQNALAATNTGSYVSNVYSVGQFFNNALSWGGSIGSYAPNGFTVTTNSDSGDDIFAYIAIKFADTFVKAEIEDSPATTGSSSLGSTPSTPNFLQIIGSSASALNTATSGLSESDSYFDAANQYSASSYAVDNVSTSDSGKINKSGGLRQLDSSGATEINSTFTAFTSTGATFNFSPTVARKFITLFVGESTVPRYGCTITVDTGKLPSTQTNFKWTAVTANFPALAIDGGTSSIINGGGNLKCYTNSGKGTQLAIEVVDFTTGASPLIKIKGLSASLGVGSTVYIEADTVDTSQPADGATYGRNACNAEFSNVYNLEEAAVGPFIDSTGNTNATATNSAKLTSVTAANAALGKGIDFDGTTGSSIKSTLSITNYPYTLSAWVKIEAFGSGTVLGIATSNQDADNADLQGFRVGSANKIQIYSYDPPSAFVSASSTSSYSVGDVVFAEATFRNSGNAELYVTGVSEATLNSGYAFPPSPRALGLAVAPRQNEAGLNNCEIYRATTRATAITAAQAESNYNVESDPSTFWTTSAWVNQNSNGSTAGVTGTATASITEADIVTGGKTIILTLSGDTFVAAGTGPIGSTADTQAIIDGITSAQTETLGWNNEVRDTEVTTAVVRTSSTVATITLTASASYDITATETITATIPAVALTLAAAVVATPTFTVAPVASGFQPAWARGSNVVLQ